jgi:CheY-like chemotaxis protein
MANSILIVDDSKLARIVAGKAILALQPHWERLEARNADEAMAIVETHQVDVVLIDYNMPGKNGLELAQELRAKHPNMPIALITANVQDEVIARARAVNATFVGKPLTVDAMRDFVSAVAFRLQAERK